MKHPQKSSLISFKSLKLKMNPLWCWFSIQNSSKLGNEISFTKKHEKLQEPVPKSGSNIATFMDIRRVVV